MKTDRPPWDVLEEEVLPHLSADALVGDVDRLRRSGREWSAPCPLPDHDDSNPSWSINTDTLNWFCFGCHRGGGPVQLLQEREGLSWMEAAERLCEMAGKDPAILREGQSPEAMKRAETRARRETLLETVQGLLHGLLLDEGTGGPGRDYLAARGWTGALLDASGLGYYTTTGDMEKRLRDKGFTPEEIKASRVTYDSRWEGRIIGPIRDYRGRVVSFWARLMEAEPGTKYVYLADVKRKDYSPFGLDAIGRRGLDRLVLVEGVMDVEALRARGFKEVAAAGGAGSSLTPEVWERLAELKVRSAVLVMDNDPKEDGSWPGREGTIKALDHWARAKKAPSVSVVDPALLGEHKDPDAFLQVEGLDSFRALLEKRERGPVWRGMVPLRDIDSNTSKGTISERVAEVERYVESLRGSWSQADSEEIIKQAMEKTGLSPEALSSILEAADERGRKEKAETILKGGLDEARRRVSQGESVFDVAQDLQSRLQGVQAQTVEEPEPFSISWLMEEVRRLPKGRGFGWSEVDEAGLRLSPGELTVIGGRTGHAKTTTLVHLLTHLLPLAHEAGETVVFFSGEEPVRDIGLRVLANRSVVHTGPGFGASWSKRQVREWMVDRDRVPSEVDPTALPSAVRDLQGWESTFHPVYCAGWPVDRLRAYVERLKDKGLTIGAVFVDYIQKIRPTSGNYSRRDMETTDVARSLKVLAVEADCPVIAGAQFNKDSIPADVRKSIKAAEDYDSAKKRIKKTRPTEHDLREGGIEQEADLILGLLNYWKDWMEEREGGGGISRDPTLLEIGVLKNRQGRDGRWFRLALVPWSSFIRDPAGWEDL